MSVTIDPLSAEAFESMYRAKADPWDFSTSAYEQGRYETTMRALLRPSYKVAFEPGCSIGELTVRLASRCAKVIGIDISPSAVARARDRCKQHTNVSLQVAHSVWVVPAEPLDLVVMSEIGYYYTSAELRIYARSLAAALQPGGEFIAVHWLGESKDHVLHGDTVHEQLLACLPLTWVAGHRHVGFRIDTWVKR